MNFQINSVAQLPNDVSTIATDTQKISLRLQSIVQLVATTQSDIEEAQAQVEEIQNRGLLSKIFSNNTRDLATAQSRLTRIVQNITEIQQYTLAFMMGLVQIHHQSLEMLAFLQDAVSQTRDDLNETIPLHRGHINQIQGVQATLDSVADVIEQKIEEEKVRRTQEAERRALEEQRQAREAREKRAMEDRLNAEIESLNKKQNSGNAKWIILGAFLFAGILGASYIVTMLLKK